MSLQRPVAPPRLALLAQASETDAEPGAPHLGSHPPHPLRSLPCAFSLLPYAVAADDEYNDIWSDEDDAGAGGEDDAASTSGSVFVQRSPASATASSASLSLPTPPSRPARPPPPTGPKPKALALYDYSAANGEVITPSLYFPRSLRLSSY